MNEQMKSTPEGFTDIPFIYVFDGRSLTPGADVNNLIVSIQEDDFVLRSIAGMSTIADKWKYYDQAQMRVISEFFATSNRWTVVPERMYQGNSQIKFDLQTVNLAANADGNDIAFAGFVGAKRVPNGKYAWVGYESDYPHWERQFTYRIPITLDFFVGDASRQFSMEITDGDFELQTISIVRSDTPGDLIADPFRITMFDPSGYNALSDKPCSPRWLNWIQGNNWSSAFPAPTLVYPINSLIKFEIDSLLNAGTQTFDITVTGVERMPC